MNERKDYPATARKLFKTGFNCAQSIAGAFCDVMGMDLEQAVKLASGLGAGFGGLRESCGTVSAMVLVYDSVNGYTSPTDLAEKTAHYANVRAMIEKFTDAEGTISCSELLAGLPGKLSVDPLPRTEEYYAVRPCIRFVDRAANILVETLGL